MDLDNDLDSCALDHVSFRPQRVKFSAYLGLDSQGQGEKGGGGQTSVA